MISILLQGQLSLTIPGTFTYSGPSFDKGVPSYKTNGTLTVVNQPLSTSFNNTTTTASSTSSSVAATITNATKNVDIITTLMAPANLLDKAKQDVFIVFLKLH